MVSSPEASSEDEFDLGSKAIQAMKKDEDEGNIKPKSTVSSSNLFSDEDDEEEEETVPPPQNEEDDDRDKEKELEDLFGSDYGSEEEEFKASGIKESPVRDENRLASGNDGNEEYETNTSTHSNLHANEIWLPRTPRASKTAQYFLCKMPNILRLIPEAYTKESIEEEMKNPSDETLYRNYVRWRYQRDDEGKVMVDPTTNQPLRESNTKLVQWEDGTITMFVGKEALSLTKQKLPNSFLFVNETSSDKPELDDEIGTNEQTLAPGQEPVLECHGRLKDKFTIRPMTTSSSSHKSLTMSMRAKHNKGVQKVKHYISELDGEREQEQRAKINDDRLRLQNRKKSKQLYEYDRERGSRMDASFLEHDDDEGSVEYDDESVGAIKEQYGKNRRQAGSKRSHPRRPQGTFHGDGFDEYSRTRAKGDKSDSEGENQGEEEEVDEDEDEDEDEIIVRSTKKRRTVEDEDSE